jgi:peptidoglycan/xylan/chitin deacetylase (PgdA/CDA1 family)
MFDLTLSFDNGPDRDTMPGVLDVLARENIPSTFFVLGDKMMVLHDLPTGAMRHLAREAGANFRQDYPPDCLPLARGKAVLPVDAYVRPG